MDETADVSHCCSSVLDAGDSFAPYYAFLARSRLLLR
jgi:hypothetical protein